jgi:hypothetical protein
MTLNSSTSNNTEFDNNPLRQQRTDGTSEAAVLSHLCITFPIYRWKDDSKLRSNKENSHSHVVDVAAWNAWLQEQKGINNAAKRDQR